VIGAYLRDPTPFQEPSVRAELAAEADSSVL
jgi:hypothetical protein